MSETWTYRANAEFPSFAVNWTDRDGNTIDFSSGYTFEVKLVNKKTGAVALTKTSGITGAATTPNVIIAWASGELNVTVADYTLHLKATIGGLDRLFAPGDEPVLKILEAI